MDDDPARIHEARFLSLVVSLYNAAWVALGKVASPVTGKVERDLEAARGSIDLLETLQAKTHGNLSAEEGKVLANCLSALRLNFVEERARADAGAAGGGGAPEAGGG
ncbi:MAG: DUF1844 domain-containing protein [bacterium]|nr:DUF1844 domain-containing protein [bacterium]